MSRFKHRQEHKFREFYHFVSGKSQWLLTSKEIPHSTIIIICFGLFLSYEILINQWLINTIYARGVHPTSAYIFDFISYLAHVLPMLLQLYPWFYPKIHHLTPRGFPPCFKIGINFSWEHPGRRYNPYLRGVYGTIFGRGCHQTRRLWIHLFTCL